ncbi:hypothetical protein ACFWU5_01890 [Nocardia sp. NPDC058640]|uniref:hypothetical protein n=1 Tax=Nocardia sp. NPDC058640 TaxID=3346571 RepID=UPI00365AB386
MSSGSLHLDFDLFLLMGMTCPIDRKIATVEQFDLTIEQAQAVGKHISDQLNFSPDQFSKLGNLLGVDVPEAEYPAVSYRSIIWPDLEFSAVGHAGYWHTGRFRRVESAAPLTLVNPLSIPIWSCTMDEVAVSFAEMEAGDSIPPYEEILFTAADGARYGAGFSWGLLQSIEKLPS